MTVNNKTIFSLFNYHIESHHLRLIKKTKNNNCIKVRFTQA